MDFLQKVHASFVGCLCAWDYEFWVRWEIWGGGDIARVRGMKCPLGCAGSRRSMGAGDSGFTG